MEFSGNVGHEQRKSSFVAMFCKPVFLLQLFNVLSLYFCHNESFSLAYLTEVNVLFIVALQGFYMVQEQNYFLPKSLPIKRNQITLTAVFVFPNICIILTKRDLLIYTNHPTIEKPIIVVH